MKRSPGTVTPTVNVERRVADRVSKLSEATTEAGFMKESKRPLNDP